MTCPRCTKPLTDCGDMLVCLSCGHVGAKYTVDARPQTFPNVVYPSETYTSPSQAIVRCQGGICS